MEKESRSYLTILNSMTTGFMGGVSLAITHYVFHYFNISDVHYKKILMMFNLDFLNLDRWYTIFIFFFLIGCLSIFIAIFYYIFLKRFSSWMVGVIYGLFLWLIFGMWLPWQLYDISFSTYYRSHSNVLTICSFLIYGVFIGYSISYDEKIRKEGVQSNK